MDLQGKLVFDDKLVSYAVNGTCAYVKQLSNDVLHLSDDDLETVQEHIFEMHNVHVWTAKEEYDGMV